MKKELSFEDALAELEVIVNKLESGVYLLMRQLKHMKEDLF